MLKLFHFPRIRYFEVPEFCFLVSSKTMPRSPKTPTPPGPGHQSVGRARGKLGFHLSKQPGSPWPSLFSCAPTHFPGLESSHWLLIGTEEIKRIWMGWRWDLEGKIKHADRTTSFDTQNFNFRLIWFSFFDSVCVCRVGEVVIMVVLFFLFHGGKWSCRLWLPGVKISKVFSFAFVLFCFSLSLFV